jgi:pimeloyl-ACP methyl ester carboxylesterase
MTNLHLADMSLEVEWLNTPTTPAISTARANGVASAATADTSRATLVFLHEGLGSVGQWTHRGLNWPLALCRGSGRQGLVYSRRGYGRSSPAPSGRHVLQADYMHREAWTTLPALLTASGLSQPVLVGHSDGATIALLHASRHPVAACVAMAPHVVVEPMAIDAILAAKALFTEGSLRDRLARHHSDVDGAFWQWNDVWLSRSFRSFDIRLECAAISAPLLLIQGEGDEYGTMRQLDDIAAAAVHAKQCRLPDCGHSPHRDQPAQTLQAVVEFLRTVG